MSDKRVTFETAKLASNVGFDWKTGSPDYMVNGNYQGEIGCCISCDSYILAPTQTILQKWLREIHNIDVEPYLILMESNNRELEQDFDCKEYTYKLKHKGISQFVGNAGLKPTYEEALEVGLQEGIKLIPEKQ
jgi:hypothetical protein